MSDLHIDTNTQGFASMTTQDVKAEKLKIRIPRRAWNAFQPRIHHTPNCTKLATGTHPKHKSGRRAAAKDNGRGTEISPASPKGCKVKVWRFQYGGPKHVVKGALQNAVTLQSPCLRATCANCWKWHTHLMYSQEALVDPSERYVKHQADFEIEPSSLEIDARILDGTWKVDQSRRGSPEIDARILDGTWKVDQSRRGSPEIDPRILDGTWKVDQSRRGSPEIDPRILDGTWKVNQSRRGSAESIVSSSLPEMFTSTPTLTPVKFSFRSCGLSPEGFSCPSEVMDEDTFRFCPDVFLPTSLMSEAVPTASMEYSRRSAHQRPRTTCLVFSSQAGKQGFRDCVSTRERKLKKAAYDRARRAKMKLRRQQEQGNMS